MTTILSRTPDQWFFLGLALTIAVGVFVSAWWVRRREDKRDHSDRNRRWVHEPACNDKCEGDSHYIAPGSRMSNKRGDR
jgi:hypothetical protein